MVRRNITDKILSMGNKFPIVTLTGPRQSGKSTLLKTVLPDYNYVSMEDPDNRLFALDDPRGFIKTYPDKTIIDEVQRVPELFSYLQTHVDHENRGGMYYLAGSQNFLLMQSISQSLAGRTAILKLMPFSHKELKKAEFLPQSIEEEIFYGGYPRIYDKQIHPWDFYPNYIQTYIEK
ncbi:MAG: AAA family ATPase, partial [Proteiniphilum sp.]|nr:AAA family ATPase [Proteiniphilum sp.]